jgi:hypothetical protein
MAKEYKSIFICWTDYHTRSVSLAHHLSASCHFIWFKKPITIPLRYFFQPIYYLVASAATLYILYKQKPDFIFVQNPPFFSALIVWFYCLFNNAKYILDTHSGAITVKRWSRLSRFHRFIATGALVNILHNEPLTKIVSAWGAKAMTLEDPLPDMSTGADYPVKQGFNVVMICTYSADEPYAEVIKAAAELPDINFYITGPLQRAPKAIINISPTNVNFTDYLALDDYKSLLEKCDVAICLTNNDNTMQCGAYEAVQLERPLITSNHSVLSKYFSKGTVTVNNTSMEISRAVVEIRDNYRRYSAEIKLLKDELSVSWENKLSILFKIIDNSY